MMIRFGTTPTVVERKFKIPSRMISTMRIHFLFFLLLQIGLLFYNIPSIEGFAILPSITSYQHQYGKSVVTTSTISNSRLGHDPQQHPRHRHPMMKYQHTSKRSSTMTHHRGGDGSAIHLPPEIIELQESLAAVHNLPRNLDDEEDDEDEVGGDDTNTNKSDKRKRKRNRTTKKKKDDYFAFVDDAPNEPTFRRLFDHDTWNVHAGGTTLFRWRQCILTTPFSAIMRAIGPSVAVISFYTLIMSWILPVFVSSTRLQQQQLPYSICGNAIGLLLVFRTNNAYRRLEEARELWGRIVYVSRQLLGSVVTTWASPSSPTEMMTTAGTATNFTTSLATGSLSDTVTTSTTTTAPPPPTPSPTKGIPTDVVVAVSRYITAFAWSLRDELGDGKYRNDILHHLLNPKNSNRKETEWISRQPSRPVAILSRLRRLLYRQEQLGRMNANYQLLVEYELKEMALVLASCQRIFTSPIPPTMTRHGLRSLSLWFLGLPIVLCSNTSSAATSWGRLGAACLHACWTAVIAFIYLGIEELGVQVEQPFRVIPLWQLCNVVQRDVEDIVLHPLEELSWEDEEGEDEDDDQVRHNGFANGIGNAMTEMENGASKRNPLVPSQI